MMPFDELAWKYGGVRRFLQNFIYGELISFHYHIVLPQLFINFRKVQIGINQQISFFIL